MVTTLTTQQKLYIDKGSPYLMCQICVLQWEEIKTKNSGEQHSVHVCMKICILNQEKIHLKGQKWNYNNQGINLYDFLDIYYHEHRFQKITGVSIKYLVQLITVSIKYLVQLNTVSIKYLVQLNTVSVFVYSLELAHF